MTNKETFIIGNSAYKDAAPLKPPRERCAGHRKNTEKLNFKLRLLTSTSKTEIEQIIEEFITKLKQGKCVGLFYSAGHGSQFEGDNYLILIDAYVEQEKERFFELKIILQ